MLRVVAHTSAAAARQYYAEGLGKEDYYSEKQEVVGKWHGNAARRLGLSGDVTPEAFAAMVENRNPLSGERITPRTKANRRVGYDINFHAPKSLSVIQALTGDRRIVAVFREAVQETMAELEGRVAARVRKGGGMGSRATGNFAWAEFVHYTARPVGGVPDPHLHVHAFTFNCTFDEVEDRWKAAELSELIKEAPYAQAAFHARLAGKVAALGWQVEHGKHSWEVAGVPRQVVEKFSRRAAEVEKAAERLGIKDAKGKDALGAMTREGKRKGLTNEDLRKEWKARLSGEDMAALRAVVRPPAERMGSPLVSVEAAVEYALEKCFSKNSVTRPDRLAGEALKFGLGQLRPEQIWSELGKRDVILGHVNGEVLCTTSHVLAEEVALIDYVRSGRGRCAPIGKGPIQLRDAKLSAEKKRAVEGLLASTSQVIMIRGAAGVGKTTLMKEAALHIEAAGLQLFAFAPSAGASRGTLRDEGFAEANTIAHFLSNKELQARARGNVIWIDEAGLIGIRDLWQVMRIAGKDTRLILTGDHFQHAPVARGEPFRLIQHYSAVPVIEVTQIHRQEREAYKKAVTALSRGNLVTAFRQLDELGAIIEVQDEAERHRRMAEDYMQLGKRGTAPLVVSPTHAEAGLVTEAIRDARKRAGELKSEREFARYKDLKWDDADKKRAGQYRDGQLVQFNQNAKGIMRGAMLRVWEVANGAITAIDAKGRKFALPLHQAERFQVFEEERIKFAAGDRIRITRNGKSENGKRLSNGDLLTIGNVRKNGSLLLSNGAVLPADFGHWAHGYAATSHSSQSRSVKDVLVAQSTKSFVASSREQFYVSVSRGKQTIRIYTDDMRGLKEAVGVSSSRLSGVELAGLKAKDIPGMNAALNGREWQDYVRDRSAQKRKATGEPEQKEPKWQDRIKSRVAAKKDFNQWALRRSRGGSQPKNGNKMDWQEYVRMRRANATSDGKSRTRGRGSPHSPGTKSPEERLKVIRQDKKAADKPSKATEKKRSQKPAKQENRTRSSEAKVKSSAAHFRKVSSTKKPQKKASQTKGSKDKGLKQSTPEKTAKRRQRAKTETPVKRTGAKQKTRQVVRTPVRRK